MAEHEENLAEPPMEKVSEKIHDHDSSSSSSSDSDSEEPAAQSSVKAKIYRLFGRERPVHQVFGGGKPADVFLWRNKKISAGVLGGATAIWVLFELFEYHLLTLVCHTLILALAILFLWANAHTFIKKLLLPLGLNSTMLFAVLRSIASGRDLKSFLMAIAALWVLSVVGSWCNFLTLFYIALVLLHIVPVLYEKYEDKIDPLAEKAMIEIKKQYAVFDAKVLSKIPVKAKRV